MVIGHHWVVTRENVYVHFVWSSGVWVTHIDINNLYISIHINTYHIDYRKMLEEIRIHVQHCLLSFFALASYNAV